MESKTSENSFNQFAFWLWFMSLMAAICVDVYVSTVVTHMKLMPMLITLSYVFVSLLFMKGTGDADKYWPCTPRLLVGCLVSALALINFFITFIAPAAGM